MLVVMGLNARHTHRCQVASMLLNFEGFQSYRCKPCSNLSLEQTLLPSLLVLLSTRESVAFQSLSFPKLLLRKSRDLLHLRLMVKYLIWLWNWVTWLAGTGSMGHWGRHKCLLCYRVLPLRHTCPQIIFQQQHCKRPSLLQSPRMRSFEFVNRYGA